MQAQASLNTPDHLSGNEVDCSGVVLTAVIDFMPRRMVWSVQLALVFECKRQHYNGSWQRQASMAALQGEVPWPCLEMAARNG